jgi:hypothetical protein
LLRYWNSDLDLEVASWFPFGVDYKPISINMLYSLQLKKIAEMCLGMESEFFFMTSMLGGSVGSLMRDNLYRGDRPGSISLGFMMLLGYSEKMEALLCRGLTEENQVRAGIAFCSLWNGTFLLENIKVIVLISDAILFNEEEFLTDFELMLSEGGDNNRADIVYFAEKFGYRRFHMAYETDDPLQLQISRLLYEMEFSETRRMVGPSPEMPFPPFMGMNLKL